MVARFGVVKLFIPIFRPYSLNTTTAFSFVTKCPDFTVLV